MARFIPRRGLRNGHVMTLYAWGRPRRFPRLPPPAVRHFHVEPGTTVLAHAYWHEDRPAHPLLLALHGLEGSSSAHYMRGLADKAYTAGFHVLLLNQRNCGGTEHLASGLYHSGLTADADHVLREVAEEGITRAVVAGYSLGGNLALKLAGDYGDAPPPLLRGVCAISPVIELGACVDALERRQNVAYQWNFVRGLRARMRRKSACHPGRFTTRGLRGVRTVRQFDEAYTAPHFGFDNAADYYYRASAMRVADRIRVPSLVITAKDDPFVPTAPFLEPALAGNPNIEVVITDHGGHCGFITEASDGADGYWAEARILEFARAVCATEATRSASAQTPAPAPAPRA